MPKSSFEREQVPVSELPEEQQSHIESLENQTDELYGLRTQLVGFYRRYGDYLPSQEVKGKAKRLRLSDLSQATLGGQSLDDLIPWDKVDADLDENIPESEKELAREMHRDEVRAEFEVAIENYNDLKNRGGDWRKRDLNEAEQEIQDYYRMRWGELGTSISRFNDIEHSIKIVESKLAYQRNRLQSESARPATLRVPDKYEKEYTELFSQAQKMTQESPEAYLYALGRQLKEAKELFDMSGRIVETPYVKTKMAHIQKILEQSRPVFIHGELGTGKTELAKHLARKELSKLHLARWEEAHPAPDDPTARHEWEARRVQETEALVVSGHRALETDQIIAARGIERGVTPVPEEQVERIRQGWLGYRENILQQARSKGQTSESIMGLESKLDSVDRELYEKAMLESFRNPIETKAVLGPLLQAAKEGRPVIIDEMNAIPHHVLIVLNDILMRRPGETIIPPVPEAEPFKVQKGFAVIATGNYKPEDGLMYIGRQPLDAAFLSRYGIVSYDYLPMQRMLEPPGLSPEDQREFRLQNELYHMTVTRLLNNDLSLTLPEGALDKLKKLAYVGRHVEDIFSGKAVDEGWYAEVRGAKVKPQDVLKENVLSIRHVLPILDRWRADGYRRDLDDYLFLDYVARSDARPEEKAYIYRTLKIQGDFFPDEKGWPTMADKDKILSYPIDQKMYGTNRQTGLREPVPDRSVAVKTYSPKQVIEELFGPAPTRTTVSKIFAERKRGKAPEEVTEEQLEQGRLLANLQKTHDTLKAAGYDIFKARRKKK